MIKNLDKINIIKRDKILKGLQFVEKCNQNDNVIDRIYIFGSSVRDDCTEDSDIDVCYMSKYTISDREIFEFYGKFPSVVDDLCDIIPFFESNMQFKLEVLKYGVLVYEYSANKN